jgi:hypothetical protein
MIKGNCFPSLAAHWDVLLVIVEGLRATTKELAVEDFW